MPADSRDMVLVPEVQYEVWQDDMPVASADRLSDAQHYMAMYGQDGPVKAMTAFTYRVDGFTSAAPPSHIAAGEDPHEMFEAFLAEAIATSPKPLQELGRFLSDLLGEDDWKTADRYLIALATIRADAWRALTEIAERPLIKEPKQGDHGKDRERCPSCGHAWHVDEEPHHAPTCDRMRATEALSASPARGEGDAPRDQVEVWGRALYEANGFYTEPVDWSEMACPDGGIKDLHLEMARAAKRVWDTCDDPAPSPREGDAPVAWWSKAERDRAAQAVCGANAIMGREPLSEGASYTFADVVLREVAPPKAVVIENTPEKGGEAHCVDNAVDARDILAGGYDARARRVARAFLELAAAQAEKLVSANTSQTACSESTPATPEGLREKIDLAFAVLHHDDESPHAAFVANLLDEAKRNVLAALYTHPTPATPEPTREHGPETEGVVERDGHFLNLSWIRRGVEFKRRLYEPQMMRVSPALADLLVHASEAPRTPATPAGEELREKVAEVARKNIYLTAHDGPEDLCRRIADDVLATIQSRAPEAPERFTPTHRHVKSGGYYQLIERAKDITNEHGEAGVEVVIYRGVGGHTWVRRASEFDDGRFAALQPQAEGGEG